MSNPLSYGLTDVLIKAWIRCAQNHSLSYLHRAIHGLIFFGTPHDGMEASHLIQAMKGAPPENLVRDLAPDSTTIKSLMDEFSRSSSSSLKIVSCYECRETPTSIKQTDGSLKRNGKNALMVRQTSACLHWTNEKRIPIIENHSMIAKLPRRPGSAYEGVKDAIFELVNEAKVFIPRRLQRFSICECVRGITAASHTVQHAVPTIENLAPSLRSSLEKGLEKLCGICELLLHEKFSNFFLGDEVTPNSIHAIGSTISHLANIFQAYSTTTIFGEGLMQITESPMRALGSTRTWDFVVSDTITSAQDELYKQPAVFELVQSISRLVDDLLRILSPLMLRFFDSASVGALTSEGFAKQSGLAHMVMQQELFRSAQVLEPECPLPGTLEVEPNGVSSEDVIMGKYMSETEPLSQAVIVEYRPYVPPKTSDRPLTVQENALVESTKTNTRKLVALLRRFHSGLSNDSSLNTLQCLGFIDDQDKGRLAFLYAIPEAHLQLDGSASPHLMSLKQAIKNKKFNKLPLETRLDLAYRLCTSIANLHCSGWVHKNISSANILCAPRRGSTSYSKLPRWDLYLKGFETSREASAKSALTGEWDKNIIYRHPDRLEEDSVIKFTKKHDIYSLGLVLFELGSRSLIEKLYNNTTESLTPGHELTPEGWQDVIKRKATNTLPSSMGIFYTDAVTTCIEGKFEDAQDDDYQTELGLSFQRLVIRKLAAGVTLWPNSQI
ncbi:hypothetical protein F5B20DRAFT_277946 [Whalleya microplaca]|nr:hypothetical protein F5B20DRAFT_277946 [Whalleya microplaca]